MECEYIAEEDDVGDIGYAHFLHHLDAFRHNKFLNIGEFLRWASSFRGWTPSVRGGHRKQLNMVKVEKLQNP
jgi:hypothetical protein